MTFVTRRNCAFFAILLASATTKTLVFGSTHHDDVQEARFGMVEESNDINRDLGGRIVGGTQANFGEFPYFVEWDTGCGASLIHSDIILTAAHCNVNAARVSVIVSAYQSKQAINGAQARTIVERSPHPNYNSDTELNDFMVMRLNSPVTGVTPIALNADPLIPVNNEMLAIMGFGDLREGGQSYPTFLQKAEVPYVSHSKCSTQYPGQIDPNVMLCAGFDAGGKDTCQGDSGGPIVRIVDGVPTQVGVTSWGDGCARAGKPGVYSRISGQITWILSEVCRLTKTNPKPSYCSGTPTAAPVPTRAPTRAPTRRPTVKTPTQRPGPTRRPTRAPTMKPTRAPTPAPTTVSTCVDDENAVFDVFGTLTDCATFAEDFTAQYYYCGWDTWPDYYCRQTCDSCWWWGPAKSKSDVQCQDSENTFYINDRLGFKNCAWLSTQETWQNKVCGWENEADFECQNTCNSCRYWGKKARST